MHQYKARIEEYNLKQQAVVAVPARVPALGPPRDLASCPSNKRLRPRGVDDGEEEAITIDSSKSLFEGEDD